MWTGTPPRGEYQVFVKNYSCDDPAYEMEYDVRIAIGENAETITRKITGEKTKDLVKTFQY